MFRPSFDRGPPLRLVSFTSPHSAHPELSLSRHGSSWFMTYPRAYGIVSYPGQRIHAHLCSTTNDIDQSSNFFWFNSDWSGNSPMTNPLNILMTAEPSVARDTGRRRMEKSYHTEGDEIECVELEVLIPDEGLLRQCYYCLDWEQPGVHRFAKCTPGSDHGSAMVTGV